MSELRSLAAGYRAPGCMPGPHIVTLTGIDESLSVERLIQLRTLYPWLEFGFLYSHKWQEKPTRYPSPDFINHVARLIKGVSLHLCGRAAIDYLNDSLEAIEVDSFDRIQLNGHVTHLADKLADAIEFTRRPHITQFEQNRDLPIVGFRHDVLFDASGGRGVERTEFPPPLNTFCGYAGGLGPHNLERLLPLIDEAAGDKLYWIDMESGIRTAGDALSLAACERVCEIVRAFKS